MQLFYDNNITGNEIFVLNEIESIHAIKVLRMKFGDLLNITDGKGMLYKAEIIDPNFKKCSVKIVSSQKIEKQRNYSLHIAIAPTKNMDRMEWFVEKSVELGIDRITPIVCRYSERKKIKIDRLEKISVSAMKQSLKYYKTKIDDIISFDNFIKNIEADKKYIAYCNAEENFGDFEKGNNNLFLVGPEGGFSELEVKMAENEGFKKIKISNARLRTETAGVMISAAINIFNLK